MNIKYPPNKKYLKSPLNLVDGASDYINFKDKSILKLMNRDNLSYEVANRMFTLLGKFIGADITTFNEFQYFTGIKALAGPNIFKNSNLEYITIPASCKDITAEAFKGCTRLKTVIITGNDVNIDMSTFSDSPGVLVIYLEGGSIGFKKIGLDFKIY